MFVSSQDQSIARAGEESPRGEPTFDLVHLAAQCRGDTDLERELLRLFRDQAMDALAELSLRRHPRPATGALAHRLRGSALAVGASSVARAAAGLEALAHEAAPDQEMEKRAVEELAASLREAAAELDRLLG